jgi:hypothetical protein
MSSAAHSARHPLRVLQHVAAVDDRGQAAEFVAGLKEQLDLGRQTDLGEREILAHAMVRRKHRLGRPNQKHVGAGIRPVETETLQHVVGHVLLVPDRLVVGDGTGHGLCDGGPFGRLRANHFIAQRMDEAGGGEIGGVERLVGHGAIGAGAEGAHHRGRDIARPRPHGDAEGGHARPRASSASSAL